MSKSTISRLPAFAITAIGILVVALLALTPAAQAQNLPAICAQYPDLPQCLPGGGGGGGDGNNDPGGDGAGLGPGGDGNLGSELPFTGYPLTPLILLLLALLATGIAVRTYLWLRQRAQSTHGPTSG